MKRRRMLTGVLIALAAIVAITGMSPRAEAATTNPKLNPPYVSVQLFRWSWNDIATECTQWLGPHGYGGVQISPPEASLSNFDVSPAVWWNMYQPVNYTSLTSDMGTAAELQTMINTCHAAGVRVYADVVVNGMAGGSGTAPDGATDGTSTWDSSTLTFPDFSSTDFHPSCPDGITSDDYNGTTTLSDAGSPLAPTDYTPLEYPGGYGQFDVQNCQLDGLPDLATENPATQPKIEAYMELLLGMGIDGFRIDSAKHQQEFAFHQILTAVYAKQPLTNEGETPWVTQEVLVDVESTPRSQFFPDGAVQEFQFATLMMQALRGGYGVSLSTIPADMGTPGNWGGTWGFDASSNVQTLIDDWDTERDNGSLNASDFIPGDINDAASSYRYDLGNIFMLASPYGEMAQVQSGYRFTDENAAPAGCTVPSGSSATTCPSAFVNGVAQMPASRSTPTTGWDFIHRWTDISNMVGFANAVNGTSMGTWTVGTNNQIAFSRVPASDIDASGDMTAGTAVGFVALNDDVTPWDATFATGLPAGTYCDILNGTLSGGSCTADVVVVDDNGNATVTVPPNNDTAVPAVAIYVGQTEASPTTVPAVPTGLSAMSSNTGINLIWTASSGATTYTVYRSTSATGTFASIGTQSSTSYADSGLTPNTAYFYYVIANNSLGSSAASSTVTATTAAFLSTFPTMYLRGSMNSWGTTSMALVGSDTWQVTETLTPNTAYTYKYDAYGNWSNSSSWGASGTNGVAALSPVSSGNINFTSGSGTGYNFTFNDSTLAYSVTPVSTASPTFTISASSQALTVTTANSATATISVTPLYGFSAAVTFACTGLPANVSCSFSPASVTPTSSAAVTTTMTVSETSSTAALQGFNPVYPASALAAVVFCFGCKRRKMLQRLMLLVVSVLALAALNGCASGPVNANSTTIPNSATITVSATSGNIQQTTEFTLTVE